MLRASILLLLAASASGLQLKGTRRQCLAAVMGGYVLRRPDVANAKYGEFSKMSGGQDGFAAGDAKNECLFAQPGSGICTVYKSSEPPVWASANTELALSKLLKAIEQLNALGSQIDGTKWTMIGQTLGLSRDLREAVGFLTAAAADPSAAAAAKKVFQDLDGIQLAAQKKDAGTARKYFDKYEADIATLLKRLG